MQDPGNLFVDQLHRVFAEHALAMNLAAQERIFVRDLVADRSQSFAHAPVRDHAARDTGGSFQVVFRAGGRFLVDQLFGGSAAQQDDQLVAQFVFRHAQPIFRGDGVRGTERTAARE